MNEVEQDAIRVLVKTLNEMGFLKLIKSDSEYDTYDIVGIIKEDTNGSKIYTKEELEYIDAYKRLKYILFSYYEIYDYYSNLKKPYKSEQEKNWTLGRIVSKYASFDYTLSDKKISDLITIITNSSIPQVFYKFDELIESIRKKNLAYNREQLIEETIEIYREIKANAFLYLNLLQYILIKTRPKDLFITKLSKHIADFYIRSDILNEKNHLLIHSTPTSFFDFNFLIYFDLYQSIKEEMIEVKYFDKIFILEFDFNIASELINDNLHQNSNIKISESNISEHSNEKTIFSLTNEYDYYSFIFKLLDYLYKITNFQKSIISSNVLEVEKLMESDSLDDLERARAILEPISFKPNSGRLCRIRGILYSKLSDYGAAEKYFREGISLNPFDTISLVNIGLLKIKNGEYYEARDFLNRAGIRDNIELDFLYSNVFSKGKLFFTEDDFIQFLSSRFMYRLYWLTSGDERTLFRLDYARNITHIENTPFDIFYFNSACLKWLENKNLIKLIEDEALYIKSESKNYLFSYYDIEEEDIYSSPPEVNNLRREIRRLEEYELVRLNLNISHKFRDKIKITSVALPNIINGVECTVRVEVVGTIIRGFFDLFIIDNNNKHYWFPDNNSLKNNVGTLNFTNQKQIHSWRFTPSHLGNKLRIFVLIFEDTDGNSPSLRKVVDGVEVLKFG